MNERNQMSQSTQNSQTGQSGSDSSMPYDPSAQGRQVSLSEPASRTEPVTTILPPVDIFEDDAGFTVIADMPGVSKDRLGVRVTGDSLVIEGTALAPVTGSVELLYGEIQNPQYRRSFTLSRELDPGKIEAKLNNGVLRLRIPKAEEAKPRRITVQVG
ncbi:Hsp20/alpha crystallin family protein [Polaromonas sp.]|uniref:Hsp20/alpha crystallin family protein n=1 Tax=Polaromonas sp. TaxID=1869339 RepID=UPI002FCC3568